VRKTTSARAKQSNKKNGPQELPLPRPNLRKTISNQDKEQKHIGRPKGQPTDKLTLQIEKGLKNKYKEFCDFRKMSISYAVSAHMKEDLAIKANLDYRTHLTIRNKPKKQKTTIS